jgi:hypothetical protein
MGGCELKSGDIALAAIPIRKMTIGITVATTKVMPE